MIYKLKFEDKTEFAQAKDMLHLLKSYDAEYEGFQDLDKVEELSDEEAKKIMLSNPDFIEEEVESDDNIKEFSVFDSSCGDDFEIIGSSEWID